MNAPARPPADLEADRASRIPSFQPILEALREVAGMGFAAVVHVADGKWTPAAVSDGIGLGEAVGAPIPADDTLCELVADHREAIFINRKLDAPAHADERCFKRWNVQSYAGTPILLDDGSAWGTLCAMNREPADVDNPRIRALFKHFARQIASEIDGRRRADAALRELLDERAGGASRERFIAILGHDLRNPMSSIAACADILKLKASDPLTLDLANRIRDNVGRMASMVSDLLDTARGRQGGGMEVDDEPIDDLADALESVVDELRTAHPDRELKSWINISRTVHGDRRRIQQLASNLLANAIEHGSEAAPVELFASTATGELAIEVHNDGAPIPPESMPGIFDAYSRRGRPDGKPREGLGLGLYICEQIAKAHGGAVSVASTREGGTRFTATLPLARSQGRRGEANN